MESKKMLSQRRWNLPCSHLHAALSIWGPFGYPWMEPTEEMGYPGRNLLKTGLSRMEYVRVHPAAIYMLQFPDRPAWMDGHLQNIYSSSFYNNKRPFYNIISYKNCISFVYNPIYFPLKNPFPRYLRKPILSK